MTVLWFWILEADPPIDPQTVAHRSNAACPPTAIENGAMFFLLPLPPTGEIADALAPPRAVCIWHLLPPIRS